MANSESEPSLSEEFKSWLDSVETYFRETNATALNLGSRGITDQELEAIIRFLPQSQIRELDLSDNYCFRHDGMKLLVEKLPLSKIKKLNVGSCEVLTAEMQHLIGSLFKTQITDLDVSSSGINEIDESVASYFIAPGLARSHLTKLNIGSNEMTKKGAAIFSESLSGTYITHLDLSGAQLYDGGRSLFSCLPQTSITDLILSDVHTSFLDRLGMTNELLKLARTLKNSNLMRLDLSNNVIHDGILQYLAESLVKSKVVDLNLKNNKFTCLDHIVLLKNSKLKFLNIGGNSFESWETFPFDDFFKSSSLVTLDVSRCRLNDESGQKLLKSLKFSKITILNVSENELGLTSIAGFAEVAKDTTVEDLNLSGNNLPSEALMILGDSLQESKLKFINLSNTSKHPSGATALAMFIEKTKNSKIESVKIGNNDLSCDSIDAIASSLRGTTFTHFNLSMNKIRAGVVKLTSHLKFSAITHIDLSHNEICDEGTEAFANCLKDTPIIDLNMKYNSITSCGVTAIASSLKNSSLLNVNLDGYKEDVLEVLIEHVPNTFITNFQAGPLFVYTRRPLSLDKVLWDNRLKGFKLVAFFKTEIMPHLNADNSFCFDRCVENLDADTFLEKWLTFYKTVTEQPSALSFLAQDESVPFSRKQLASLFVEEFPHQFTLFIGTRIEADISQHIKFLERVETYGLSKIAELLLLNRPTYMIDENQGILHPFVYKLLLKYKQPVCNVDIEPQGKQRIIEYFTTNVNIEGASDVVRLLCEKGPVQN